MIVKISDVKKLLNDGKSVKVKTENGQYSPISRYIEKGKLETFEVVLKNNYKIRVTSEHKFFTNAGWLETKNIRCGIHSILCDTNEYSVVESITYVGIHSIVDITVDDENHAYFGNGILNHNSGKSLIGAHIIASAQRKGGLGILIDTETAVNEEFLRAMGVDTSRGKFLYSNISTVEEIFEAIVSIIENIRVHGKDKDRLVVIVVDSVAGASTKIEMEADFNKDGWATQKAIIISKALRKITNLIARQRIALVFTNQLRQKMNAPAFSDPWCVDPLTTKVKIRYKIQ